MISKVTGCMESRKSLHLINDWLNDRGSSVCIKPIKYSRDGAWIKSRACNVQIPCLMIGPGIGHSFKGVDTLYVDEAFGFTVEELRYLSRMAENVRFYGLDLWADGTTTSIGEFICDEHILLTADCKCGKAATMSKHVSGDAINGVYEAVCRECWEA